MFPRSDNIARVLLVALLLLLGALSLVAALSEQFDGDDEDAKKGEGEAKVEPEESEENLTWSSIEAEREFEVREGPENEIDIGTLLELYKEYQRPTQGQDDDDDDEDDDSDSRFSLFGLVGRIRNKMRKGKNFPRSIFYDCPSEPARHDPDRRAKMLYYNPASGRTSSIEETRDGSWPASGVDTFKRQGFDLSKPTVAIMGGYLQTGLSEWILLYKKRLLEISESGKGGAPFNLLIYDWAAYSLDFYEQSVSFVPHMGSNLAKFFEMLIDNHDYKVGQVQLVSFSLSTHITGLAGRQLRSKYGEPIPVIHALDPTGVCFHDKEHVSGRFAQEYALRSTDAKLVLARHYNMKQLGAGRFIGGVDIVVNDGKSQPVMYANRLTVSTVLAGAGIFIASHMRTVEHETISVPDYNSECHEIAYECSSYEAFQAGECGHCRAHNQSCIHISTLGNFRMGQRPVEMDYKPGTIMFMTTGRRRYCEHTFQVVARLDEPSAGTISDFRSGKFRVKIGDVEINPSNHVRGNGKVLFTQLLRPARLPAPFPDSVQVGQSVRPLLESVKYIALTHMSHILREVRRSHSIKYCPDNSTEGTLVKCK